MFITLIDVFNIQHPMLESLYLTTFYLHVLSNNKQFKYQGMSFFSMFSLFLIFFMFLAAHKTLPVLLPLYQPSTSTQCGHASYSSVVCGYVCYSSVVISVRKSL